MNIFSLMPVTHKIKTHEDRYTFIINTKLNLTLQQFEIQLVLSLKVTLLNNVSVT